MASLYKIKDSSGQWSDSESPENLWTGEINEYLSIGGDMRSSANATSTQNQKETFEFSMDDALLYIQLDAIPNRLILYLDEQLAPGTAYNREAFALFWNSSHTLYLMGSQCPECLQVTIVAAEMRERNDQALPGMSGQYYSHYQAVNPQLPKKYLNPLQMITMKHQ